MAVNRLFEIVYTLLRKRQVTAAELAAQLEVSTRTIYRDIDVLSASGVPIYALPGKHGGIALMDGYALPKALFSQEEQEQLLMALQSLGPAAPAATDGLLSKLNALFQRPEQRWIEVDFSNWASAPVDRLKFDQLRSAIVDKRWIAFTYRDSYGRCEQRRVKPARLVFKTQAWYLQAWCALREAYRTFKIRRIQALEPLEEYFEDVLMPPPIDFGSGPVWTTALTLRVAPHMAFRMFDEFDTKDVRQLPDGAWLVETEVVEDGWLYGYLLSMGSAVEVLSPARIRDQIARRALEILETCRKVDIQCQQSSAMIQENQDDEQAVRVEKKGWSQMENTYNAQTKFCQSCGMPMEGAEAVYGRNADGSQSADYCNYCYDEGAFKGDMTMTEMIDFCVPMMVQQGMDEAQARKMMQEFMPMLKRWKAE